MTTLTAMFTVPVTAPAATTTAAADAIAHRLAQQKHTWARVPIFQRLAYLRQCVTGVAQLATVWAETACHAKGIDPTSALAGEEWFTGPAATLDGLQSLIRALQAGGQPRPVGWRDREGQAIAQVFPASTSQKLLWPGYRGEVWLEPGQPRTQGRSYREPTEGQLALVLGAGNISSIAPLDALYKLFVENAVVLLKLNPVNDYMGPILAAALAPLCDAGVLEVVYGDGALGAFLCDHPAIDTIHVTGSHQTYDAIAWGSPADQATRPANHQRHCPKPITAELGAVTPILVVPDRWSPADLQFQARHVAGMVVHNASFNCAAAQLLVTARGWPQRQAFLAAVQQELAQTPVRKAYYPGAVNRYHQFLAHYPQARALTIEPDGGIPWTLIPDVPPEPGEYALQTEAFCGVLAEVSLPVSQADAFLSEAVMFANEQVWGNLSCVVLAHPRTQRQQRAAFDRAIAQLRYGAIGINLWSGVLYAVPQLTWGAFPGNHPTDIQSGQGVVHNALLFDHPQKSVMSAPFRVWPLPSWFARHQNLRPMAQAYTRWLAQPHWLNLLRVIGAALRG